MLNYPVVPASEARSVTPVSSRILSALTEVLHFAWRKYRRWKTIRELQALDDRMLKDIGLDRSEIGSMANTVAGSRPLFPGHDFYRRGR